MQLGFDSIADSVPMLSVEPCGVLKRPLEKIVGTGDDLEFLRHVVISDLPKMTNEKSTSDVRLSLLARDATKSLADSVGINAGRRSGLFQAARIAMNCKPASLASSVNDATLALEVNRKIHLHERALAKRNPMLLLRFAG